MAVCKEYIRSLIKKLKFELVNGSEETWIKRYNEEYNIKVNFEKESIDYENENRNPKITVCSKTTSNFSQLENMVVLECIDRLLEKGYKPDCIELEHSWPSGHGTSGRLDIMVKKDNKCYLMIECKTYGKEYEKEKSNMLIANKDGESKGQLFSYCWEEKSTEYLCLYSSCLKDDKVIYQNAIIQVEEEWKKLSNKKELFDYWNKIFKKNGIFEEYITPYNIETKRILRGELEELTDETSSRIFNQFLEILRHNSVSDKPNAFNKILNLFICKIIDEDRNDDEEVDFQWNDDSSYISMQSKLEDLYRQGMRKFLNITVTDYSDSEIDKSIAVLNEKTKDVIRKMFQDLRLQKNSEFAFKEVYNQESFEDNAKVVKEIVELLQPYQFRYGHKQQFLGNFFELLLNTSIKQESGQFFTPVPISRFMISSLPIKNVIDENIKTNKDNILPVAIDYACGTGHFLTEYMDIVQKIINDYNTEHLRRSTRNIFEKWKQNKDIDSMQGVFEWAKEYVYGIEKDYRLVKAAKISTFLNGDGDANIILADGLDKFSSAKYIGDLRCNDKVNEKFDFVIANPPYSVSSFRQTLPSTNEDFVLYNYLTKNSSEIECMFVERTYQLLKNGGCAAIILPASILTNTGVIYEKTREIILKNFYIKAIAKMGSNTFMATGTNTIIVFLEKRNETDYMICEDLVDKFIKLYKDFSYDGVYNVIKKYVEEYFEDFTTEEYINLLKNKINDKIKKSDNYINISNSYKKKFKPKNDNFLESDNFKSYIVENERKKLILYLMTFNTKTILLNAGEKQKEKEFLGYEFSNRRGYEGIHYFTDEEGKMSTALYDDDILNENSDKANYYIKKAFLNEYPEIPEELREHIKSCFTNKLLNLNNAFNGIEISITPDFKINIKSDYNKEYLKNIAILQKGTSITERETAPGKIPVVAGGRNPAYYHNTANREADIITVSASGANAGYINYWDEEIFASDCTTIKSYNESKILTKYIYIVLKAYQNDMYMLQKGQGQPHVYPDDLGRIKMPIPPLDIQEKIIKEYFKILDDIANKKNEIMNIDTKIENYVSKLYIKGFNEKELKDLADLKRGPFGGALKKEIFVSSGYKVYEQKHAINNDFSIGRYYINKEKFEEMKAFEVKANDIIMSCSGTIGKFAIAPQNIEAGIINQALLRFRSKENILPEYLKICLEHIADEFRKKSHGLGLQNVMSVDNLKIIKIPVPEDIEEQKEIVHYIKELESKKKEYYEQILKLESDMTVILDN